MPPMPMFPLGSVLFPGMPLPLHVFEPRYRALVQQCIDSDPEFGVVLIERGSEVGGGDTRAGVGTVARLVEATRFEDGRWAVAAVGLRRIRVREWLPDDPYPIADVEDWPDADGSPSPEGIAPTVARFRQVLAAASELGLPVPPATAELDDDPAVAVLQMAAVAPVGPADRYDLLAAAGPLERLSVLSEVLDGCAELLSAQVALGGDGDRDDPDDPRGPSTGTG